MGKTFKKVRLFKISRELNVTVDTLVEHLEEEGYEDALSGSGLNASVVIEDAYDELLEAFAADKEVAARVKEKRAKRAAEARAEAAENEVPQEAAEAVAPSVEEEPPKEEEKAAEKVAEKVTAEATEKVTAKATEKVTAKTEKEVGDETEDVEVVADESVDAADEDAEEEVPVEDAVAEEAVEEAVAEEAATEEPVAEEDVDAEAVEDVEAVEADEVEAVASDEVDEDVEAADAEKEVEAEPEVAAEAEETADASDEPEIEIVGTVDDEEEEESGETLSAKRYQLAGTKVLGTMDLSEVEDDKPKRRKRKRKRKRKAASTDEGTVQISDDSASRSKKKKKRKRGKGVDEEDVEETLQKTLRELEMGASRARQRRRRRRRERHAEQREQDQEEAREQESVLRVTEFVSTGELANLMDVAVNEVIQTLFESGMIVSINQRLDADTISYVADEYDYDVEFITEFGTDDIVIEEDDPEDLKPRAPIVTVMGHVDHGKTSLLDYIRSANVVAGEAGGITQHIGAHKVELPDNRDITFLDTPGHEAFTAMRARGAKVTDVVVLVVAADDSVMPQTIEAINHAKAAEVPIVVAINKIDKPEINTQKVMQQLSEHNVLVEQYGGKVQCAMVSAMTGEGIDDLLDKILLESELMELKANPNRNADGIVIESRLEKGRGNVATVLVRNGTLRVGDDFVAGIHSGRVRAMFDERENRLEEAGPSQPSLVLGFSGSPEAGDQFVVLDEEKEVKDIAQRRQQIHREQSLRQKKHITLDEIGRRLALGDFQELNLIIKADVGGSVEALSDALLKLSTEEVALNIIHSGVGAITESDVMLASASDAVIIGFQVRPDPGARQLAEREEIDIRTYSVIYDAIEDVHDALEGLLSPEKKEVTIGTAEVRDIFKVPKAGTVAGCYIVEGKIRRNDKMRVIREGVVVYDGEIDSLKRFKDDVREVQNGYECGISIQGYNDIKVGDHIEGYEIVEEKRTLEV
ncbi:MAG: translation initiation factor IF-2 [Rhodothermales bacterium]